ncbi:MAG TPA: glycosyltransferase family 4 protein [Lacunisphaera sp.]|jgi:glycosyltransferase involved in cell wall biosynthesis
MRISIVNGFFLPLPPVAGGATEKSWYNLAHIFAERGHEVTVISRRWPGFPDEETRDGIRHIRLCGADHRRQLWRNLLLDFLWSWRVSLALPTADIVVVNAVALPAWLGKWKPRAGRVVIMTGRMPKGQYRHYRGIARVLAASSFVRDRVVAENPTLAPVTHVVGYPINWQLMNPTSGTSPAGTAGDTGEITIGYVGRIHEEKGLLLLADALKVLSQYPGLPAWRLLLCGPSDVERGGSGPEFRQQLTEKILTALPADRFTFIEPQFDESALAGVYRRIAIFCYPSIAAQGETFGVAVAEAMAAGAVPLVSRLACFTDFVRDEKNGLVFDHNAPDAASRLATALARLLRDTALRSTLAQNAPLDVRTYDYAAYADSLLTDFGGLISSNGQTSSRS